jgi:hypothetical protein
MASRWRVGRVFGLSSDGFAGAGRWAGG